MKNIEIKPLAPEYYQANLSLMNAEIKESHFLARSREIQWEEGERFLEAYKNNPDMIYLVALFENKLIGHCFALPRFEELIRHTANIGYLVNSDFRRKGVFAARHIESEGSRK